MVLVIGCVFGLICSLVAGSKQRNPIGWFAIGFFFPIIGLILAIVLPENSPESSPVETSEPLAVRPAVAVPVGPARSEFTRPCPACGGLIHPAARTCMHCFTRVAPQAAR